MALISTPGAADANTFASLSEFNSYATNRLPSILWFATATDGQKESALILACLMLSSAFKWTGKAADGVQILPWPRIGMYTRNEYLIPSNINPIDLKNAQCEYALQLGAGDLLSNNEAVDKQVSSVKAGSVEVAFQGVDLSTRESVDMMMSRLGPEFDYTRVPNQVRLLLVDTWYERAQIVNKQWSFQVFG